MLHFPSHPPKALERMPSACSHKSKTLRQLATRNTNPAQALCTLLIGTTQLVSTTNRLTIGVPLDLEPNLLIRKIESLAPGDLQRRQDAAELALLRMGITFAVYGDDQAAEKIFPFDIVPRIIDAGEWELISAV